MCDGSGDCLVVTVLFCHDGDSDGFEEDLRCGPKQGLLVDLMELDGVGATLFKTAEALRGAFFFSTSVELKTKGAGGGWDGREIIKHFFAFNIDPKHFFAVSAICFNRSDLACTCFSGRFLVQSCGRAT